MGSGTDNVWTTFLGPFSCEVSSADPKRAAQSPWKLPTESSVPIPDPNDHLTRAAVRARCRPRTTDFQFYSKPVSVAREPIAAGLWMDSSWCLQYKTSAGEAEDYSEGVLRRSWSTVLADTSSVRWHERARDDRGWSQLQKEHSSGGAICPWLGWGTRGRWFLAIALACASSVVRVTHGAPFGGPLLEFGTEPALQEGISRHFLGVPLTKRNPTETRVPLALYIKPPCFCCTRSFAHVDTI